MRVATEDKKEALHKGEKNREETPGVLAGNPRV